MQTLLKATTDLFSSVTCLSIRTERDSLRPPLLSHHRQQTMKHMTPPLVFNYGTSGIHDSDGQQHLNSRCRHVIGTTLPANGYPTSSIRGIQQTLLRLRTFTDDTALTTRSPIFRPTGGYVSTDLDGAVASFTVSDAGIYQVTISDGARRCYHLNFLPLGVKAGVPLRLCQVVL